MVQQLNAIDIYRGDQFYISSISQWHGEDPAGITGVG